MDGNLAATYTLIHAFLTKRSHTKAALALKKAVKDVVILKDDIDIEGPHLDEIIKQWKALNAKKNLILSDSDSSSSSSDSSDSESSVPKAMSKNPSSSSSSSDSDSSSSKSDSSSATKKGRSPTLVAPAEKPFKSKSKPVALVGKAIAKKQQSPDRSSRTLESSDTSDSDADFDSTSNDEAKQKTQDSSDDSRDSSSSDSEYEVKTSKEKVVMKKTNKTESSSSSSDSDSGSSDSKEEDIVDVKGKSKAITAKKSKILNPDSSGSSDSSSDSSSDERPTTKPKIAEPTPSAPLSEAGAPKSTKKRRISIGGTAVTTATTDLSDPKSKSVAKSKQGKAVRKANEPFRRIKPQEQTTDEIDFDNRYEAKVAPMNDYGAKAHQDLIVTRGAGFRKEKNKKKRGSYRGGEITMQSHSFKFAD